MVTAIARWRYYFREPGDVTLMLAVGAFIAIAPRLIAREDWRLLLRNIAAKKTLRADAGRVKRMRTFWLCKRFFASHNTCYIRALTLYRFLDERGGRLGLHIGIERREPGHDRLHGHAWVTLDEEIVEGPPAALEGRIREIRIPAVR